MSSFPTPPRVLTVGVTFLIQISLYRTQAPCIPESTRNPYRDADTQATWINVAICNYLVL